MSIKSSIKAVSHWPLLRYFAHLLAVCVRKIAGAFAARWFWRRDAGFPYLAFWYRHRVQHFADIPYLFLPDRRFTGLSSLNNARRVIISGHYRQNFCFSPPPSPLVSVGRCHSRVQLANSHLVDVDETPHPARPCILTPRTQTPLVTAERIANFVHVIQ